MIVDWVTIKWAAKSCMVGLRVLLNTVQFLNKGNGEPQAIDSGVSVGNAIDVSRCWKDFSLVGNYHRRTCVA